MTTNDYAQTNLSRPRSQVYCQPLSGHVCAKPLIKPHVKFQLSLVLRPRPDINPELP